jgi:acetylornithine deacetylase/succinyl-diaminopimelate desuccinylase-like protein
MTDFTAHIEQNRKRYIDELVEYLRIPSISSSSAHKGEVKRAADYLAAHMERIGLQRVEVFPTPLHPIVYGDWLGAPGKPTVLIYGHYDVQPVDPLELWRSPPFEPEIRGGELYARGSVDDKGQVYIHLKAIEAHLKLHGTLPLNVKFIAEGEEEIGSEHLEPFMREQAKLLEADVVVVSDTPMYGRGVPSVCYGLRGLAYAQIDMEGPTVDIHSGSLGGIVANPVNEMARIIAALKDGDGVVKVPGFYDDVRALSPRERQGFADLPQNDEAWRAPTGSPKLHGEKGYSTLERLWARAASTP